MRTHCAGVDPSVMHAVTVANADSRIMSEAEVGASAAESVGAWGSKQSPMRERLDGSSWSDSPLLLIASYSVWRGGMDVDAASVAIAGKKVGEMSG